MSVQLIKDLDSLETEVRGCLSTEHGRFHRAYNRRLRLIIKLIDDLKEDVFEEENTPKAHIGSMEK